MSDHTDIVNMIIAKTEEPPEWIFKKFDITYTLDHWDDEVGTVFETNEEVKVDNFVLCLSAKKVLIKCKGMFVCELDISIQAPPRCKAIWVAGADNTACDLAREASKAHKKAYNNQIDDAQEDIRRFFYEGVYGRLQTGCCPWDCHEIEQRFEREWVGDQDPKEMCMDQICDEIGDIVRMYSLGYLKS